MTRDSSSSEPPAGASAKASTGASLLERPKRRPKPGPVVARVSLLIPSHALPAFSYRIPRRLVGEVRLGAAVVAHLSGYPRLGIVVGFEEEAGDRPLEELRSVAFSLSLPENLTKLCLWAAIASATPTGAALRAALPPGLETSRYQVVRPTPGWPWKAGAAVNRTSLRRVLGGDGLKAAEGEGRVVFEPALPARRRVEWAVARDETYRESLGRAPRQRELLGALLSRGGSGLPVADLLRETGAGRDALRRLVDRGAVCLERRPEPAPVSYARGSGASLDAEVGEAEGALRRGSASWVWRMPRTRCVIAAAAVARSTVRRGGQALVLAPTAGEVERLVEAFQKLLPAGLTVAAYHGDLEKRGRAAVYEAARRGEVDVLVGTRAAALVPVESLGAVCVMDEPDEAHRAKRPKAQPARGGGYEGIPLHARELARARGRLEGAGVFLFSPTPSLRLYAPESGARRLPPVEPERWPSVSVVDMRGTGSPLSPALIDACRRTARRGRQAGVLVNRLGRAASFRCNRCGFVWTCPSCDLPLKPHEEARLSCGSCGRVEGVPKECPNCGSDRLGATGLAVEGVRERLAEALDIEVGLLAAGTREEAPVVVGPARCVLEREWDLVVVPDADDLLSGSAEKGFRVLYAAAEASREALLVQTRSPEDPTLRAALEGDYEAFAAAELPKRRSLGYPPHAHLAEVTFQGDGGEVRRAVESALVGTLAGGVEMIPPVPVGRVDGRPVWRALLKGRRRADVAEAAALVGRLATKTRGAVEARIEIDPEEV